MSYHIGAGYGSEFHLMRYLARYRNTLDDKIKREIGEGFLEWLDFIPGTDKEYNIQVPRKIKLPDHEITGVDFLREEHPQVFEEWKSFWPQSGNQQNWDAVCRIEIDGTNHWLLVEAKANTGEIKSSCGAEAPSMKIINAALSEMQKAFNLNSPNDLTRKYYQYANRLAVLYFLSKHIVPSKLLFIYFTGDKNPEKEKGCPKSVEEWKKALEEQYKWIGLDPAQKRTLGIHDLFLDVVPSKR